MTRTKSNAGRRKKKNRWKKRAASDARNPTPTPTPAAANGCRKRYRRSKRAERAEAQATPEISEPKSSDAERTVPAKSAVAESTLGTSLAPCADSEMEASVEPTDVSAKDTEVIVASSETKATSTTKKLIVKVVRKKLVRKAPKSAEVAFAQTPNPTAGDKDEGDELLNEMMITMKDVESHQILEAITKGGSLSIDNKEVRLDKGIDKVDAQELLVVDSWDGNTESGSIELDSRSKQSENRDALYIGEAQQEDEEKEDKTKEEIGLHDELDDMYKDPNEGKMKEHDQQKEDLDNSGEEMVGNGEDKAVMEPEEDDHQEEHMELTAALEGVNTRGLGDFNSKARVRARLSNPMPKTQAVKGRMYGGFQTGHVIRRELGHSNHPFHWPNFQSGQLGFCQRWYNQFADPVRQYSHFHERPQFGYGGLRSASQALSANTWTNFSGYRHDLIDRKLHRPAASVQELFLSEDEWYARSPMGRHMDDPESYAERDCGIKRPLYISDQDAGHMEPSGVWPRFNYSHPVHGAHYTDTYAAGSSSSLYSSQYFGIDYNAGQYPSFRGSNFCFGGGYFC